MALSHEEILGQIRDIYREGFEGPAHQWSYYTGEGRGAALFGTLDRLTAVDASRSIAGSSIAAHLHHTIFGLRAQAKFIRGIREKADWESSFGSGLVNDGEWEAMKQALQEAYADTGRAIEEYGLKNVMAFGGALSAVGHLAYHLGVIRQKMLVIERGL